MQNFIFPSLLEVENGIHFFSTKGKRDIQQLKHSVGLWKRIPSMGTLSSFLAGSTDWWVYRFLLPILIDTSLYYVEKMRLGDWKRKDEERLHVLVSFLLLDEVQKQLTGKASPLLLEFIFGEVPSFWQQRDLFRKEAILVGLKHENCSWHQHESFLQYCERMKKRVSYSHHKVGTEESKQKHIVPIPEEQPVLSKRSLSLLKTMKERNKELCAEVYDLKQQVLRHKRNCFLVRLEAADLYSRSIELEQRVIVLAIRLEELVTTVPDEALLFMFHSTKELEEALGVHEDALQACLEEKQSIVGLLEHEVAELAKIRKQLLYRVKNLTGRLDSIERIGEHTSLKELSEQLIAKGHSAVAEFRASLTRLPGVVVPLSQVEKYIEDIVLLCHDFFEENRRELEKKK